MKKLHGIILILSLLISPLFIEWPGLRFSYAASPRNVILITIDTIRADHLGCYGYKEIETPRIDEFAKQGVLFEKTFSPVPLTLPSHTSILTGTYPPFHGIRNNGSYALSDSMVTLAEYFRQQNYVTAAFVSSFILDRRFGLHQGFSEYNDKMADDPNHPELFDRERRAEGVTRECVKWLSKTTKKKFFLWLHYMDPHEAYHPPSPYSEKYAHNLYDGEIAYTDHWIGIFLDFLQKENLLENTLIVLTGDHGESLGDHGESTHGIFIYDATLHVPLIIRYPALFKPARISSLVRLIDIAPTILQIMNIEINTGKNSAMQGVSLVSLLEGKKLHTKLSSYCESLYPKFSHGWSPLYGIRTEEHKYIQAPEPELFAMVQDPHELINIFTPKNRKAKKLAGILVDLKKEITSPLGQQDSQAVTVDEKTRERMRSLGYVMTTSKNLKKNYPDPKRMISVLRDVEQGAGYFVKGEYEKALEVYQQVIKKDPRNTDAYLFIGYIYESLKQPKKSIHFFEKCIQLEDTNLKAYLKLGLQYMQTGQYSEGVNTFKRALELNPRCANAYLNLGQYYLMQTGEITKSREFFLTAIKLDPKDPMGHNLLALSYQKEGHLSQAVAEYRKSLELEPAQAEVHLNLGTIYQRQRKYSEAALEYEKALHINPELNHIQQRIEQCRRQQKI